MIIEQISDTHIALDTEDAARRIEVPVPMSGFIVPVAAVVAGSIAFTTDAPRVELGYYTGTAEAIRLVEGCQ